MTTASIAESPSDSRLASKAIGVVAVIVLGGILRVLPALGAGFPLNDGGLFLTMGGELREAGFSLPFTTAYNGLNAPFAYPPLAFYVVAALESIGLDGSEVLRWIPIAASIGTVGVVYLIGRELFNRERMALGTAAFFAVSTASYEWLIMGGGITRAPGFLFALAAVWFSIRAYRNGGWWLAVGAGVVLGATGLTHPQAAVFGGLSVVVLLPFTASDLRSAVARMVTIVLTAAVVVTPWVVLIVGRHGLEPFISAGGTGGTPFLGLVNLLVATTGRGAFQILSIATLLGVVVCMLRGFWLAPAWLTAVLIVDSRAGQLYASVPAAMAVTFMVRDLGRVVGLRWQRVGGQAAAVIGLLLIAACFADSIAAQRSPTSPLRALPPETRAAMEWVVDNTDANAAFAVVSGTSWQADAEAEWFPVLAERRSLTTVQGYEWLGADAFLEHVKHVSQLPVCVVEEDLQCIESWLDEAGDVDYLFLTISREAEARGFDCCLELADQVAQLQPTETVYESPELLVVHLP